MLFCWRVNARKENDGGAPDMEMRLPQDTLGKRIRALRKEADLSQEELGRIVGISTQGIGLLERDKVHDPHISTVYSIAKALNTTVGRLVDEQPETPHDGPGGVAILDQVREHRQRMNREKKARARVERLAKNRFNLNPSEVIVLTQMLYYDEENPPAEDGIMVMGHVKKKDEPLDFNELRKILLTLIEEGVLTDEETSAAAASIRAAL
jgi:transcriptional regulator with XRE-family HTH domain